MMSSETRRQAWYALAFLLVPATVWAFDRFVPAFGDLPRLIHWVAVLALGLLVLVALRFTNPWETPAQGSQTPPDGK